MTEDDKLDRYIDGAAAALNLPLDPAWKDAVKANLKVTLAMTALVESHPLPDEAEPAPIYRA